MITDKQKIEKIIELLTDKNVGKLIKKNKFENADEEFGALVFASYAFRRANIIAKK